MVTISLDLSPSCDLCWDTAKAMGQENIFWKLELGLKEPLEERVQFLSLQVAMKHFVDTVLAKFGGETILYEGPIPDLALLQFLKLLAVDLPHDPFLALHKTSFFELLGRCSKEAFYGWRLLLDEPYRYDAPAALLLPYHVTKEFSMRSAGIAEPFRFCHEEIANEEWEGVETLYIAEDHLTPLGRRMAQGFAAASGKLVQI